MLDYRGQIAESTGANIFLVQNGVIQTPKPDCFLDGITRRTVIELARKRGYQIVERAITPDELARTQEVFLTGTAAEVTPVGSIDQHRFTVGTISKTLMQDYENLVRRKTVSAAAE
jgi:branched-chain amino acid aminotransferase